MDSRETIDKREPPRNSKPEAADKPQLPLPPCGSWEWNPATGETVWSEETYRIYGVDRAHAAPVFAAFNPRVSAEDRTAANTALRAALEDGKPYCAEFHITRADGSLRLLRDEGAVSRRHQGEVTNLTGIVRDITEHKMLEERFRNTQSIQAIGNLTGSIAHEFNNLLFVVLGNLDLLEDCVSQDGDILQLIEAARRGAARGANLTERMLAFSRRQYLEPESLYLDHLIPGLVPLLQRVVGENVTIEIRMAESLRPVFADRGQIDNALFHLAANARDALPAGGTIVIAVDNILVDVQAAANHADAEEGCYVCLSLSDDGAGMTADVIKNAAAPFFTTKDVGKGAGLGLSTVFGFACQSGGFAKIESRIGEGTTVSLYLPQAAHDHAAAEAPHSGMAGETILIVQDEAEVRELVSAYLRELGYRVIEAGDGRAARAVLEGDERIDLLLCDIAMPHGLSGPELAEIGLGLRPGLRLAFLSGYREDSLADSGADMAGIAIVWKPYKQEEIARLVAKALEDSTAP